MHFPREYCSQCTTFIAGAYSYWTLYTERDPKYGMSVSALETECLRQPYPIFNQSFIHFSLSCQKKRDLVYILTLT